MGARGAGGAGVTPCPEEEPARASDSFGGVIGAPKGGAEGWREGEELRLPLGSPPTRTRSRAAGVGAPEILDIASPVGAEAAAAAVLNLSGDSDVKGGTGGFPADP